MTHAGIGTIFDEYQTHLARRVQKFVTAKLRIDSEEYVGRYWCDWCRTKYCRAARSSASTFLISSADSPVRFAGPANTTASSLRSSNTVLVIKRPTRRPVVLSTNELPFPCVHLDALHLLLFLPMPVPVPVPALVFVQPRLFARVARASTAVAILCDDFCLPGKRGKAGEGERRCQRRPLPPAGFPGGRQRLLLLLAPSMPYHRSRRRRSRCRFRWKWSCGQPLRCVEYRLYSFVFGLSAGALVLKRVSPCHTVTVFLPLLLSLPRRRQAACMETEREQAVRTLFYETLNRLRQEEKNVKAEAWMFEGSRHTLPDN